MAWRAFWSIAPDCARRQDRGQGKRPHPLPLFRKVVEVNLIGSFNVLSQFAARAAAAPDVDGERGVIVNTASVAAFDGQIGQAAYAASKGGIVGMTLPLARDLAQHHIRVMGIAPAYSSRPWSRAFPSMCRTRWARRSTPAALAGPRICPVGRGDHHQCHAEWRGDPAGWRGADGAALILVANRAVAHPTPRARRVCSVSPSITRSRCGALNQA
jgi:NAD(P)-dependent dehydrogenase (short-subunit alcohol dehydrogenase family)